MANDYDRPTTPPRVVARQLKLASEAIAWDSGWVVKPNTGKTDDITSESDDDLDLYPEVSSGIPGLSSVPVSLETATPSATIVSTIVSTIPVPIRTPVSTLPVSTITPVSTIPVSTQTLASSPIWKPKASNSPVIHTMESAIYREMALHRQFHQNRMRCRELDIEAREYAKKARQVEYQSACSKAAAELKHRAQIHDLEILEVDSRREELEDKHRHMKALHAMELKHQAALHALDLEEKQNQLEYQAKVRALKLGSDLP